MDQTPASLQPSPAISRRRFTVAEYYRMAEAGILRPDERVELIDGSIARKQAIGSRHVSAVIALNQELTQALGRRAMVSIQNPVRLDDENEPEPDIAVLKSRPDRYAGGHPGPADVLLLVEVADTSLDYDRAIKRPLYARYGIPELWIVNLVAGQVEVCRAPGPGGYASVTPVGVQGTLDIAAFPSVSIAVADILPPR